MTRLPYLLLVALVTLGVGACNTVRGAGEDIESGGAALSETAEDAERALSN